MSFAAWLRRLGGSPGRPAVMPSEPADLGAIRSKDRGEIPLRHPVSGDLLGASVTLASPDHPVRRQARLDISRAQRDRGEEALDETAELVDAAALDFIVRITLGWSGIKVDGVVLAWSVAAARELYGRDEMRWLVNQLLFEAARTENFIETSAPA